MKSETIEKLLVVFVISILSIYFIFREITFNDYNVSKQIEHTEQLIIADDWEQARNSINELKKDWEEIKFIVILNYVGVDVTTMDEYLNLLVGSAEDEDKSSSLSSILQIKFLWNNMKKLIPQP